MKKIPAFLLILFLLSACRKSQPDITTVKYEFTTDVSAKYQLAYAVSNNTVAQLLFNGTSWSQSVRVSNRSRLDSFSVARLTAYPPSAWAGTPGSAHISLTIRIDGDEKVSVDTIITGASSSGITELYTF